MVSVDVLGVAGDGSARVFGGPVDWVKGLPAEQTTDATGLALAIGTYVNSVRGLFL